MTNKKIFLSLILSAVMCVPMSLNAQVTIGSGDAPRATLDVRAAEGIHPGIIVPNVDLALLNATVYTPDQTGAVVYVYSIVGSAPAGQTVNVTEVGFYYFDGAVWQSMSGETAAAAGFVLNAADATLVRTGAGTEASPFLLARAAITGDVSVPAASNAAAVTAIRGRNVATTAPTVGQALMWDGTNWTPATPPNDNTTYTGSTSIILSGTSFQRAALTGDVTAAANNNATTVARIRGRNVATTAPTVGQALMWNGTSWTPTTPPNTTYTGSTSIILSGTSFERAALTGDVTSAQNSNATIVTGIQGRNVDARQPGQNQVYRWDGTIWTPSSLVPAPTHSLQFGGTWSCSFGHSGVTNVLLVVVLTNQTEIRVTSTAPVTSHVQSLGSTSMVQLNNTWRALPVGMHLVSTGPTTVELRNRQPVSTNMAARILYLTYWPAWL